MQQPVQHTDQPVTEVSSAISEVREIDFWRVLRLIFGVQGIYYLVTGLLPQVLGTRGLYSVTNLVPGTLTVALAQNLTALIGLFLLIAVFQRRPSGMVTGLAATSALLFAVLEARFRQGLSWLIYAEIAVEVFFALAVMLAYLLAWRRERRAPGYSTKR